MGGGRDRVILQENALGGWLCGVESLCGEVGTGWGGGSLQFSWGSASGRGAGGVASQSSAPRAGRQAGSPLPSGRLPAAHSTSSQRTPTLPPSSPPNPTHTVADYLLLKVFAFPPSYTSSSPQLPPHTCAVADQLLLPTPPTPPHLPHNLSPPHPPTHSGRLPPPQGVQLPIRGQPSRRQGVGGGAPRLLPQRQRCRQRRGKQQRRGRRRPQSGCGGQRRGSKRRWQRCRGRGQ